MQTENDTCIECFLTELHNDRLPDPQIGNMAHRKCVAGLSQGENDLSKVHVSCS